MPTSGKPRLNGVLLYVLLRGCVTRHLILPQQIADLPEQAYLVSRV